MAFSTSDTGIKDPLSCYVFILTVFLSWNEQREKEKIIIKSLFFSSNK